MQKGDNLSASGSMPFPVQAVPVNAREPTPRCGDARPGFLRAAGILQGFYFVSITVTGAMTFELVPAEQMGRWLGIIRFVRLLLSAGSAYAAGVIWDKLGPQYVFITVILLDLFIRIPLLIGMPETLDLRMEKG